MKLIKSLMGRRQFLMGACAASAAGLVTKKIAGGFAPVSSANSVLSSGLSAGIAAASEESGTTAIKYPHLLSPLKIRNKILKNRMMYSRATPHFLQGPETYPAEVLRSYFANLARSAALITCRFDGDGGRPRNTRTGDSAHIPIFDLEEPGAQNYIDQMIEGVHSMGSLVTGISLSGDTVEDIVARAKMLEAEGIDVVSMRINDFQDKGAVGTALEQMQAVRSATGLLIMINATIIDPSVRPETDDSGGGTLIEDAIRMAKTFEGSADILFFKAFTGMTNHPTSFNMEKGDPVVLRISQAIKESGTKIITCPNGGFRDPDMNEAFIARGKTDMIAMCRAFISDPDYGEKVYEGRGEDTVPCIMCNKCHGISMTAPWYDVCSVNPKFGISTAVNLIKAPKAKKKVAVIGGGPAGMKAALTAAERGHSVTLYEKNGNLGGLLRHADFSPYKWALRDFKDYLVREVHKAGVAVRLNTEAAPEMIRAGEYDAVLVAVGAEPVTPNIPGAEGENVWNFFDVYGKEKELGKNVVFIGGGEFGGVETGMYLAKAGHRVTVLTSAKELLPLERVHYPEIVMAEYDHLKGYDYVTEAIATGISNGKVTYTDVNGKMQTIKADDVVIYGGLRARQNEALSFYGSTRNATTGAFFTIGDCTGRCGDVQKSIRSAFFTASLI